MMEQNIKGLKFRHADYLGKVIPTACLRETVKKLAKVLRPIKFDAIAFRGMSGALICPTLALRMNKSLIMVRKEESHSALKTEGCQNAKRYVIVDDLSSTGKTLREIHTQVRLFCDKPVCVGVLLYCDGRFTPVEDVYALREFYV